MKLLCKDSRTGTNWANMNPEMIKIRQFSQFRVEREKEEELKLKWKLIFIYPEVWEFEQTF